jgi:PiT family inorganic phosphate transporter
MTPLIAVVALALAFDFLNGFHDSANSIATIVSTRVLSPGWAVAWAAFFNFVAFLLFGTHVAANIAHGVDAHVLTLGLVAAALTGAILLDLTTWWLGLPTSSSHALLGGMAGAAVMKAGFGAIDAFFAKTALFIVISPLVGAVLAFLLMTATMSIFGDSPAATVDRRFRRLQLLSAAGYSLGHGGNDAQKTMGVIVAALVAAHHDPGLHGGKPLVPLWVVLACHAAMAAGTASGGWRIVRTLGTRIVPLTPADGFCAETAGAITLLMDTVLGIPVSTTHTITGGIVGVGLARQLRKVRWTMAGRIAIAWVLTVPGAAAISAASVVGLRAVGIHV